MERATPTVRWGILGTGQISTAFATGLTVLPDAALVAIGSRAAATAGAFGARFGIPRRGQHASYDALADDPDVDIVFVGTPHQRHLDCTLRCLAAGKAVMCEKPFAINTCEARAMVSAARNANLLLMEAMWMRFTPAMVEIRALLEEGSIGEVRMVSADLGFRASEGRPLRLFDLAYGGGALLDVGVYLLSFASMILGTPTRLASLATLGDAGVDEQAGILLGYDGGQIAILSTAIRTGTPVVATIMGTSGRIDIHSEWHKPTVFTLHRDGHEPSRVERAWHGNGYNYEAAEAMRALRAGELESPIVPLDETLAIVQTMDHLRAAWELRFPADDAPGAVRP